MANNKPSLRTASGKVFWRLAPIILGIVAYFGLGAIEGVKHSYDKERTAPIVITDQTNIKNDVYEIGIGDLQKKLDDSQSKPQSDAQGKSAAQSKVELSSWEQLQSYIKNIKFQRFKDEGELSEALNEQVLAERAANERKHQYRREGLNLSYAAERLFLFNEQGKIETNIEKIIEKMSEQEKIETNIQKFTPIRKNLNKHRDADAIAEQLSCSTTAPAAQPAAAKTASNKSKISQLLPLCKQLQDWEPIMARIDDLDAKYNKEQNNINSDLNSVDDTAQEKLKRVYLNLRPALAEIKSGNPVDKPVVPVGSQQPDVNRQQTQGTSLKNYNFQSVLDDNNGIHVIYQVIRLILVVLLVFGIISVGLALLRLFPSYASSSEALTDKAKTFLSSNSDAAPNIARAAVISLAAIGIGTAVVVAGSQGSNSQPSVSLSNDAGAVTQNNRRQTDRKGGADPGETIGRTIPMPYPVPYPSPVTVQPINNNIIPPLDEKTIELLKNSVESLRGNVGGLQTQVGELRTNIDDHIMPNVTRIPGLINQVGDVHVPTLKTNVDTLSNMAGSLQDTFFAKLDTVSGQLNTTNTAMTGIRNDSLAKLQRPEGLGLFTRVKQFFSTKERYFVSAQSYEVLKNLLCTADCSGNNGSLTGSNSTLLNTLFMLKNDPTKQQPMTDEQLLTALGGADSLSVRPWKSIILRYTRLP